MKNFLYLLYAQRFLPGPQGGFYSLARSADLFQKSRVPQYQVSYSTRADELVKMTGKILEKIPKAIGSTIQYLV